ncbi:MAG: hypothetical protein M1833_006321 [Piccolia ochrophora]|nr:MAG: hypothetical protein M1833_006321 [Piccolia ochrophora]
MHNSSKASLEIIFRKTYQKLIGHSKSQRQELPGGISDMASTAEVAMTFPSSEPQGDGLRAQDFLFGKDRFNGFLMDRMYDEYRQNNNRSLLDIYTHLEDAFQYEECCRQLDLFQNDDSSGLPCTPNSKGIRARLYRHIGLVERQHGEEAKFALFKDLLDSVVGYREESSPKFLFSPSDLNGTRNGRDLPPAGALLPTSNGVFNPDPISAPPTGAGSGAVSANEPPGQGPQQVTAQTRLPTTPSPPLQSDSMRAAQFEEVTSSPQRPNTHDPATQAEQQGSNHQAAEAFPAWAIERGGQLDAICRLKEHGDIVREWPDYKTFQKQTTPSIWICILKYRGLTSMESDSSKKGSERKAAEHICFQLGI